MTRSWWREDQYREAGCLAAELGRLASDVIVL